MQVQQPNGAVPVVGDDDFSDDETTPLADEYGGR